MNDCGLILNGGNTGRGNIGGEGRGAGYTEESTGIKYYQNHYHLLNYINPLAIGCLLLEKNIAKS